MTDPNRDFLVLSKAGDRLAGPVYCEEATLLSRLLPAAYRVVRMSTGALISSKKPSEVEEARPLARRPWFVVGPEWGGT